MCVCVFVCVCECVCLFVVCVNALQCINLTYLFVRLDVAYISTEASVNIHNT